MVCIHLTFWKAFRERMKGGRVRFMLLAHGWHEKRKGSRERAKRIAMLLRVLVMLRERYYLTTTALKTPSACAWNTMYQSRDTGSFLVMVSLSPRAYDNLLVVFSRHYVVKSGPSRRGRPPRMQNKNNVLACIHFYTAAVEYRTLCELFGVPPATLSRVLTKAELALTESLMEIPDARISWPSFDEQRTRAECVSAKESLIKGCFCVADGKNYTVQVPTASDLQNAYFNGM